MKTPREILLARHRAAETRLDAVRERAVAALDEKPEETERGGFVAAFREFFRVPPMAWGALGAAWVVILALNLASRETLPKQPAPQPEAKRSSEMLLALREQKRLFAELVGATAGADADLPRFVPRPRSEAKAQLTFA